MAKRAEVLGFDLLSEGRFRLTRTRAEVEESDGEIRRFEYEIYHYKGAAAVLPYDPARGLVLLVRQFRLGAFLATGALDLLEVPAGMLDGDSPEVCAEREAMEETGFRVHDLSRAFTYFSSPGSMTEAIACFVARYRPDEPVTAGGGVDADERIERVEMTMEDALARIDSGEISDGKTVALLYYARAKGLL
jgi:nudix-type nucleoside diphosphatase (YffH/AdpP family)